VVIYQALTEKAVDPALDGHAWVGDVPLQQLYVNYNQHGMAALVTGTLRPQLVYDGTLEFRSRLIILWTAVTQFRARLISLVGKCVEQTNLNEFDRSQLAGGATVPVMHVGNLLVQVCVVLCIICVALFA